MQIDERTPLLGNPEEIITEEIINIIPDETEEIITEETINIIPDEITKFLRQKGLSHLSKDDDLLNLLTQNSTISNLLNHNENMVLFRSTPFTNLLKTSTDLVKLLENSEFVDELRNEINQQKMDEKQNNCMSYGSLALMAPCSTLCCSAFILTLIGFATIPTKTLISPFCFCFALLEFVFSFTPLSTLPCLIGSFSFFGNRQRRNKDINSLPNKIQEIIDKYKTKETGEKVGVIFQ